MSISPSCLAPDHKEIAGRIERVRSAMRQLGVSHYVCQSPDNILYLTNVAIQVHERPFIAFIRARGYGENLFHRTGHSFGVTGHEAPFLADGYEHEIRPNMVFSIEPGIYLPGVGGFRLSDTVLVTGSGNLALTRAPDSLHELTLAVH